jgi:hypothetical protein
VNSQVVATTSLPIGACDKLEGVTSWKPCPAGGSIVTHRSSSGGSGSSLGVVLQCSMWKR